MTSKFWTCICLKHTLDMGMFGGETNLREKMFIFDHARHEVTIEHPGA